ncbi:unnamed protein product (macronuclear) [Paramecium tetraurelia]|uniref:Transmembrane protein n=1 Tax=Paramecium tetraurelia TaxID=5888 RepID=A0DEG6_PARTE|nr:uncharacterized protein GSPATT00016259001 [Paramecium tetraurelia]CAK81433.1 unnamed protein product [Paramecium tetraurelia]|eukprot:XP_001448830.1 hypothetical protein (macronuclear) [Paramecium tetraurelia strain d4-2]
MFNYLNVIQLIIISINMFTGLMRAGLTITRKKNPIDNYIFLMFFFAILTLTAEIINLFLCKQTVEMHLVCVGTWITFSLTLQQSLAFMAILQFLTFFLLQTQSKEFLDEMKKSQNQFIFFAILAPIIFNLLNLFVHDSQYRIFYPPNNRFQVIVLFAPLTFLLIIISIFTGLSIKMLRTQEFLRFNNTISQKFHQNTQSSIIHPIDMLYPVFIDCDCSSIHKLTQFLLQYPLGVNQHPDITIQLFIWPQSLHTKDLGFKDVKIVGHCVRLILKKVNNIPMPIPKPRHSQKLSQPTMLEFQLLHQKWQKWQSLEIHATLNHKRKSNLKYQDPRSKNQQQWK